MGFMDIDGSKIYYEDSLNGDEVLVCIHGFISSSICWHPLVNHLSKRYRLVAFDLPGFGKPIASTDYEYTLKNFGVTTNQLVEKLGLQQVHLVAHSLGGQVALQAVKNKPNLYDKLFLIAASAKRKRPPWMARLFCYFPYVDEAAYRFYFQDELVNIGISKVLAGGVGLEQEVLSPYIEICKKREVVQAVLKLGKEREDDMNEEDLKNITNETYLLWGREDQVVKLSEGVFLKTHLKNSTLAIIEHCGHLPMEEYPTTVLHHLYSFFEPNSNNAVEIN
jgi:pimeloyl-ACP methyl ester carboxylesterase